MIDIRVLGTLEIRQPNGAVPAAALTQPKRIALLVYLALAEPAGPKSRDRVMALLWPEADEESARHSLRNALYGLRQTLGEDALISRGDLYIGLDSSEVRCDALEVRRLLTARRWQEALAAWGGDLLPGFHVSAAPEFDQWLEEQRTGLRRAVTEAAWRRVDELEKSGDGELAAAAQRAWSLDPADETGARRLMRVLDASVGRDAALRAYGDVADYFAREIGAEPSRETRALAEALKARVEAPPAPRPLPPTQEAVTSPLEATPPGRRGFRGVAAIAGMLIVAAVASVFALRPARLASPGPGENSMSVERDSAFRLPARYRQDTSAYASYLRGLALRFLAPPNVSRDTFAALVARKPLYAPGLSGLAHAYALSTIFGEIPPAEGWPKVEATARKAIAMDSASASAYIALGSMEMFWHWNMPLAGRLIDKGLGLEPADPEAHAVRGTWFRWQALMDSDVAEARKSRALDPVNPMWAFRLARQLYLARQYSEAEQIYRQLIREYPTSGQPYGQLSDVYRAMGRTRDALDIFRTGQYATGDSAGAAAIPVTSSDTEATKVFTEWARSELRDELRRQRNGEPYSAGGFVEVYAKLEKKDETILWLDSMLASHDPGLPAIQVDPTYDFLRGDPRYDAWLAKLPWRQ
ncbi:MAG TPA: BTAD domain-containing putative transcriptional regulator [Gemmatimonadales bacterium]|jgi:DNA-binding SARP family transcriptional activator